MLHVPEVVSDQEGDLPQPDVAPAPMPVIELADRVPPRWVAVVSTLFSLVASVCLLVVPVLALSLQTFPTTEHGGLAATLTGLIGLAAIAGALVFDFVQMRALAGYRSMREGYAIRAALWLGALIISALLFVHPFVGMGPLIAAGIAAFFHAYWRRHPLHEPSWEFNRKEAVSLLIGRDAQGMRMAATKPNEHAYQPALLRGLTWGATLVTLAASSGLASQMHLNAPAIPALAFLAFWATDAVIRGLMARPSRRKEEEASRTTVMSLPRPDATNGETGLVIKDLQVQEQSGRVLLSDLDFTIPPGSVVGVIGATGSGKSLLLQTLQAPHDLHNLEVRGTALINSRPIWTRTAGRQTPTAILLADSPLILPTSGLNNLTCFHVEELRDRGQSLLEQLVFSVADAQAICETADARSLPGQQRKLLAMARAFLLSPPLYLMDRPEDGLEDRYIAAICDRIAREKKLGRCFLIVTENRALLEMCDQLIVMQEGRVIDMGPTAEVRGKMTAGWSRLVTTRSLDSEENLVLWVRNLFKRPGDEGNRRAVSLLASEMLALSCQTNEGITQARVEFEFKHLKGNCLLRMIDDGPVLSSGAMERARQEAARGADMTPLATVLRATTEFACSDENGRRVIEVKKATYDPRNGQPSAA